MKPRIYIDTSVIGGYFDDEFKEDTQSLFRRLGNGEIIFIVSDLLELELMNAPQKVRELISKFPAAQFEHIAISEEAAELAQSYIEENVVGKTSIQDCRHIALATIHKADVLVSWNFKHIVNLGKIKGYNSVNLRKGYQILEIRSPRDLINYEND